MEAEEQKRSEKQGDAITNPIEILTEVDKDETGNDINKEIEGLINEIIENHQSDDDQFKKRDEIVEEDTKHVTENYLEMGEAAEEVSRVQSLDNVVEFIPLRLDELVLDKTHLLEEEEIYIEPEESEDLDIHSHVGTLINDIMIDAVVVVQDNEDVGSLRISYNIADEVIHDILVKCIPSGDVTAKDDIREIMELDVVRSGVVAARELIDTLIDRCISMNRIAASFINNIVQQVPSISDTDEDANEEIVEKVIIPEKTVQKELFLKLDKKDVEECLPYIDVFNIANTILGTLTVREKDDLLKELKPENLQTQELVTDKFPWPHIKHFNIVKGLQSIITFVRTWSYKENWLFNVEYLMPQCNKCSDFYLYEAKFGIPTKEYPIPQATVSVFFTIEVSRVLPISCPVRVTYVYESNRVVHDGTGNNFHEEWLFNVIDAKLALYKRLDF